MSAVARRLLAVLLLLVLLVEPALAQKRGGGSFGKGSGSWGKSSGSSKPGSSGGSRTPSKSPSPAPSGGSGSSGSKPSSNSWGSRPSSPAPRPKSASTADELAHQKAVQGNSFAQSGRYASESEAREAAITDFRQKYRDQFPSEFKEQPKSRPEYVPERTTVNGREVPVSWRNEGGRGGYYYYDDALSRWILYDMMLDSARRDRYMYREGYDPSGTTYVRRSGGGIGMGWLWVGILLLVVIAGVVAMYYYYNLSAARPVAAPRRRDRDDARPPPPPETRVRSKQEPGHWDRVKPGDIINLKDRQTLELLMQGKVKNFALGADLTVKSVRRITEQKDLMRWTLAELDGIPLRDSESAWYLLIKIVDDAFDLRVMFAPADFTPGNRAELVAGGTTWLFKPPADDKNFDPADLEFADGIDQTLDDGRAVVFERKPQGILFGGMTQKPKPSGLKEPQFVGVVEYRANVDCPNPELLLLEVGGVTAQGQPARGGGLILLYQGSNVGTQDVELMPV